MLDQKRSTAPLKLVKLVWANLAYMSQKNCKVKHRKHGARTSQMAKLASQNTLESVSSQYWTGWLHDLGCQAPSDKRQSFLKDTLLVVDSWSWMKSAQTFTKPLPHFSLLFRVYLFTFGTRSFATKLPVLSSEVSPQTSPSPERLSISTTSISSPSSPDRMGSNIATCTTPLSSHLTIGNSCHSWFKNPAYTCIDTCKSAVVVRYPLLSDHLCLAAVKR